MNDQVSARLHNKYLSLIFKFLKDVDGMEMTKDTIETHLDIKCK